MVEDWGYINSASSVTIKALGLAVPEDAGAVVSDPVSFGLAVKRWTNLISRWLVVLADGPTSFVADLSSLAWLDEVEHDRFISAFYRAGYIFEPNRITRDEWRAAVKGANSQVQPPIARWLLAEAKTDHAQGELRSAVLSAATSAEVALATWIRAQHRATESDEAAQMVAGKFSLGTRLEHARKLGLNVPATAWKELVSVRNSLIHRGIEVSAEEARNALEIAVGLVDDCDPLEAYLVSLTKPETQQ